MTQLTILHLYPEELGIFGDVGNVLALRRRAEWRGLTVRVLEHRIGDALGDDAPDLIHIGNGAASGQRFVHADLLEIAPSLRVWAAAAVPVLAIGAGWQLLGRSMSLEGAEFEGADVFPSRAVVDSSRRVGNVVMTTSSGRVMGFENHAATTERFDGALPFGTELVRGIGNGDGTDGVVVGSSIGTNLGGPLLPLNPTIADGLLTAALARTNREVPPIAGEWAPIADAAAAAAGDAVASAVAGVNGWLVSR